MRERGVDRQIDEPFLFAVELLQAFGQVGVHGLDAGLFLGKCLIEQTAHVGNKPLGDLQGCVVVDDRLLNHLGRQVRQIALTVLPGTAQEVAVVAAVPTAGFGVDQSRGPVTAATSPAEGVAFQVMLENAVALAGTAAHVQNILDTVEEFLGNDRLVFAAIAFAIMDDPARVVRIVQHPVQHLERHRALGDLSGRSSGQAEIGHGGLQQFEAVFASAVQLPCRAHQRSSLLVQTDGIDPLTFVLDTDIEVAESGDAERSAVDSFVSHLGLDVEALQCVL